MNVEQALQWADGNTTQEAVDRLRSRKVAMVLSGEVRRLRTVEIAAHNLIAQKGRHNTEIAYKRLEEALKSTNA